MPSYIYYINNKIVKYIIILVLYFIINLYILDITFIDYNNISNLL